MATNSKEYMKKYMKKYMTPKRKEENAARKRASRKKKASKGKEVDHKDGNPMNNSSSNLQVISRRKNRIKGAKKAVKTRKKRKKNGGKY